MAIAWPLSSSTHAILPGDLVGKFFHTPNDFDSLQMTPIRIVLVRLQRATSNDSQPHSLQLPAQGVDKGVAVNWSATELPPGFKAQAGGSSFLGFSAAEQPAAVIPAGGVVVVKQVAVGGNL